MNACDAATSSAIVSAWISADGQGIIPMPGMRASKALAALLSQCGEEDQRAATLAGNFLLARDATPPARGRL